MKKLLLVAVIVLFATVSNAQFKYGGGLTLGTQMSADAGTGIGLNVRGDYTIDDNWSISPGFTFVFPSSNALLDYSAWQLNADAHYNFHETDGFQIYGLAGLNYTNVKFDVNLGGLASVGGSDGSVGLDLGAGANFGMFFGELKYDTAFEQLGITVGVLF